MNNRRIWFTGLWSRAAVIVLTLVVPGVLYAGVSVAQGSGETVPAENHKSVSTIDTVFISLFLLVVPFAFYLYALGRRKINQDSITPSRHGFSHFPPTKQNTKPAVSGQTLILVSLILIIVGVLGWVYIREIFQQLINRK
ncbi:hypothetical protein LLG96_13560 [bacterium]|nr:hypothetical protein [bacterium]